MIARQSFAPVAGRGNLLADIKVQYGPTDLIGRFLLLGNEEALQRGITLSLAGFDELVEVNEQK